MKINPNLLQVHLAVFLFGFAGLFGEWLDLPSTVIVLGRVFFGSIALFAILTARQQRLLLNRSRDYAYLCVSGVILAVHWSTFFQSIQVSNVAVGLIAYATFPVFVTFMEPMMAKQPLRRIDVVIAVIAFAGAVLVVPSFELENQVTQGFLWGLASSFTFALLSLFNKHNVASYSSLVIALYQDVVATIVLIPFLFIGSYAISGGDWLLLVLLGVIFTAGAGSLYIQGLSGVRAQVAGVIASLEPVYGIALALVLLGQVPSLRTLLGGAVILGAAIYSSVQGQAEATA